MSIPTSHKLAPFLDAFEPDCEGPIAGYASYCFDLHAHRSLGVGGSKSGEGLFTGEIHFTNTADFLKEVLNQKFDQLLDLFCVDLESHFRLYYLFGNSRQNYKTQISLELQAETHVPSLSTYYASADWLECECFDLFGVHFENHPHLKRLLLYPEFAGHPLRKHYPIDKAQPLIPLYA